MTDLKKLSEEMAEEYAREWPNEPLICSDKYIKEVRCGLNIGFKAGFQSCLDLLAKQSGDFATVFVYKVDLSNGNKTCSLFKKLEYIAPEWKPQFVKFIDHAALLSANAKIAKLEEEITKKHVTIRNDIRQENAELQQRVKELESEEKALQTIAKDAVVDANKSLEAFTICDAKYVEACGKLTTLEAKLQEAEKVVTKVYESARTYLQNKGV